MKKLFLALLIALGASASTHAQQANVFTGSWNSDSSCTGHNFGYSHYLNAALSQYGIEHSFGNGFIDTIAPNNAYNTYFTYNYPAPGTYTVKAVLLMNNNRVDSEITTVNGGPCSVFSGLIYKDQNGNCGFNYGVDQLLMAPVQIRVDSANIPVDTFSAFGTWYYRRNSSATSTISYKFTILDMPPLFVSTCQTASSVTVNAVPGNVYQNINFGYTCSSTITGFDASGMFLARMRANTAGVSWIEGHITNAGCTPQSGTATLKISPKFSIFPGSGWVQPAPASIVGNVITWNYTGVSAGQTMPFYVRIVPNQLYTQNDTGCNTLTVNPITGDLNPANNVISRCDSLRNSWDPNDKSVSPQGNITAGTTLTYHINFENLGNDTAFNVHVMDTLSSTLDASSFKLTSASHPVRVLEIAGAGGSRILKFDFPNIRLAEKTKPQYNKGFVRFSIKTKTGLAGNTNIPNRAGIYFDFNPVVMTNTVMNKIGAPQSVEVLEAARVNGIYPNPATDRLTITNADGTLKSAVLLNATGQVVRRWNLVVGENSVSLEAFPAGLYLVQLYGESGVQVEKLEKR